MLCFDQTGVYLKPVAFLPDTMLDQKDFLRVFCISYDESPFEILFISYKVSGQCFTQSI